MERCETAHRIDWTYGYCLKCGLNHEIAAGVSCVPPILSEVFDALLPAKPWPTQPHTGGGND
jgi:hypothetical protein